LLNAISRELPEDYTELEEEEDLPELARYWVNKAEKLKENLENFSKELRELSFKFRI
jgi:hypothetical protein